MGKKKQAKTQKGFVRGDRRPKNKKAKKSPAKTFRLVGRVILLVVLAALIWVGAGMGREYFRKTTHFFIRISIKLIICRVLSELAFIRNHKLNSPLLLFAVNLPVHKASISDDIHKCCQNLFGSNSVLW